MGTVVCMISATGILRMEIETQMRHPSHISIYHIADRIHNYYCISLTALLSANSNSLARGGSVSIISLGTGFRSIVILIFIPHKSSEVGNSQIGNGFETGRLSSHLILMCT